MAGAVHVERAVQFLADDLLAFALQEAQCQQAVDQHFDSARVWLIDRHSRTDRLDGRKLRVQYEIVDRALRLAEATADGKRTGDIGAIAAVLSTGVDEQQVFGAQPLIVGRVVEDGGVDTGGDDRGIRRTAGPHAAEGVVEQRLDLVLVRTIAGAAHGGLMALRGNRRRPPHAHQLLLTLDEAHLVNDLSGIEHRRRSRYRCVAAASATAAIQPSTRWLNATSRPNA